MGCWLLKFSHALEFDQALLAHIAIGVGGTFKNFKGEHSKLSLKFHTRAPITLGVVGVPSRNYQGTWLEAGVIRWTPIFLLHFIPYWAKKIGELGPLTKKL